MTEATDEEILAPLNQRWPGADIVVLVYREDVQKTACITTLSLGKTLWMLQYAYSKFCEKHPSIVEAVKTGRVGMRPLIEPESDT